ncbi:uncharacterized protein OCT59_028787 [Rhizophagus irregularis]|uniref:Uncharacterized protein n=1 Tax=Rhizophagus irregularis (strain DAOM 197198w) TaxID=1432141 RepID=A0A015K4P9_RHIIW|nr:hypothetical protein RirG_049820 [Rhizophagus irregularis DAOM 197198w]UZO08533.1 hypothetical protein OCT59_028787 [Rhizophagus irregularis]GBC52570.1 hypothetical protein GLOIN_2v1789185 [Rhizophagus irregularis DAOM 181602=DAOM 197198]
MSIIRLGGIIPHACTFDQHNAFCIPYIPKAFNNNNNNLFQSEYNYIVMAFNNDKVSGNIEFEGSSTKEFEGSGSEEFNGNDSEEFEESNIKESKARKLIGYLIIELLIIFITSISSN